MVTQPNSEEFTVKEKQDELRFARLFPESIQTIAIVTPASVPRAENVRKCISLLEAAGYRVKLGAHALDQAPEGAMRIPVEDRVADFMAAWLDPEVDLILCTRGGEGTIELIQGVDWEAMKGRPDLSVIGYSDVTLLLCAMLQKKIGHPITAPMCSSLVGCTERSLQAFRESFRAAPTTPVPVTPLRAGDFAGPAMGGHLERLHRISATPFRPETAGRVLFIECVRREAEELRGYLDGLLANGFFADVAGVVFCGFTQVQDLAAVETLLAEFTAKVTFPVMKGFPYGHQRESYAIDFRRQAVVKDNLVHFE